MKTPAYAARLDQFIAEDRLTRREWTGTDVYGQKTVCLLAALSPKAGKEQSAESCPARIMPPWLAHLTVWIDDEGSQAAWLAMILRYASLAHRWHVLGAEGWNRIDYRFRVAILDEASKHYDHNAHPNLAAVVARVRSLCTRAADGNMLEINERALAAKAAMVVLRALRNSPISAVRSAGKVADVALTATWTYDPAVFSAADKAAWAAAWAAAGSEEARTQTVDRLTAALFEMIEAEIASC